MFRERCYIIAPSVLTYPHPILRRKIEYNTSGAGSDQSVIDLLFSTSEDEAHFHGREIEGIAANQIGIDQRILLYRNDSGILRPLINPHIMYYGTRTDVAVEGCGSLPGYECEVERALKIQVHHFDQLTQKPANTWFKDWPARIIQHEVDHLEGILILDREYGI